MSYKDPIHLPSMEFTYNSLEDIFLIEGIKLSGSLLRALTLIPEGTLLKVTSRKDNCLYLEIVKPPPEQNYVTKIS